MPLFKAPYVTHTVDPWPWSEDNGISTHARKTLTDHTQLPTVSSQPPCTHGHRSTPPTELRAFTQAVKSQQKVWELGQTWPLTQWNQNMQEGASLKPSQKSRDVLWSSIRCAGEEQLHVSVHLGRAPCPGRSLSKHLPYTQRLHQAVRTITKDSWEMSVF